MAALISTIYSFVNQYLVTVTTDKNEPNLNELLLQDVEVKQ